MKRTVRGHRFPRLARMIDREPLRTGGAPAAEQVAPWAHAVHGVRGYLPEFQTIILP